MADYQKTLEEFQQSTSTKTYTKSGISQLANAYFNDPEYKSHKIVPTGDGGFTEETSSPAADFRTGLKGVMKKHFGIDAAEADKLNTIDFPRSVTDPMLDGVSFVQKDYLDSGRALKIPMTKKDETAMSVFVKEVGETSIDTKRIEQTPDGTWQSIPTGETVTHMKRNAISVSNKVPGWLTSRKKK